MKLRPTQRQQGEYYEMDVNQTTTRLGALQDWQQAHRLVLQLLQGQQTQREELVQVRTKETEAQIMLLGIK